MKPPKWADRFLAWYCNPSRLEEIQGDAYELFERDAKIGSIKLARLKFIWNVIRFFRWSNIKRTKSVTESNHAVMIRNYLLTGFRSALRHRLNSIINITGLALGVAGAVTVFIFIDHQTHSDTFHQNQPRIYQVTNVVQFEDHNENWGDTPLMLAPALAADYAGIEAATRIEYANAAFRYNDLVFNEFTWFVDKDFTRIFDFPVLRGNGFSLDQKDQIILVKEIAEKYFGQSDPIGQQVSIKFGDRKEEFTIGAVIERPNNSSIFPQILLSIEVFEDLNPRESKDWSYLTDATFIMLKPGHAIDEVQSTISQYIQRQNEASPKWRVSEFKFYPLKGLANHREEIVSAVSNGAHPSGLLALGVIAILFCCCWPASTT